jgi:Predicted membrane protein
MQKPSQSLAEYLCIIFFFFAKLISMKNKFIICGLIGWCMEIFWTGFESFKRRELKLVGQSSFWMFPIYGMAALLTPISRILKDKNLFVRGGIYSLGIFAVEYITGSLLKKHDCCPWDYSKSKFNINGVIRLDYFPVWFVAGLLFEKILKKTI